MTKKKMKFRTLTTQLIDQIENLNLGGEDKKLFEFINRMMIKKKIVI